MAITGLNQDGLTIPKQDLSAISPGSDDDARLYNHDGSSAISLVDGNTTTNAGYYMWDDTAGAWNPMKATMKTANDINTDGSTAVVRDTTGGLDVAQFHEGGDVTLPNGALTVDSVLKAHGVKNLDNLIIGFWGDGPPIAGRGIGVLQMGDDSAGVGDAGYATGLHFITEAGERIATMAADKTHNHWGIYTRGSAFDGTDAQPIKRFNIAGGSPITKADYYKIDQFRVGPRTSDNSHGSNMDFIVEAESTGDINLRFDHNGSVVANYMYDQSRDSVRIQNSTASTVDFLELETDGTIDTHGHPFANIGTISNSSGATIYDDANGHIPTSILQSIGTSDLAFDTATQSELDSHASSSNPHGTSLDDARSAGSTVSGDVTFAGENKVIFGDGNYWARYDSGEDTLKFGSAENGAVAEIDSAGNLIIEGSLTESGTVNE